MPSVSYCDTILEGDILDGGHSWQSNCPVCDVLVCCSVWLLSLSSKHHLSEAAEALLGDVKRKKTEKGAEGSRKSSSSRKAVY